MGRQVVIQLDDGRQFEIHSSPAARPGRPSGTRVYRRSPKGKAMRVGRAGIAAGGWTLQRATPQEAKDVAEHLIRLQHRAEAERTWRGRMAYQAGAALAWLRMVPPRVGVWCRIRWRYLTSRWPGAGTD